MTTKDKHTKGEKLKKQQKFPKGLLWLVMGFAFVLYANTLGNGYVLDDDVVYLQNRYVQSGFDGIDEIFSNGFLHGFNQRNDQSYRPLVLLNFAVEKAIFGNNPAVNHFFNLLFYALACGLFFYWLLQLFGNNKKWLVLAMALIFVAHPIHTEVVANIKGRDDILHLLFILGALIFAFRYIQHGEQNKYAFGSLLCFFGALLCKELAVAFVLIIPLSIYFFSNWPFKKLLTATVAYGATLFFYLFLRNLILENVTFEEEMTVINNGLAAAKTLPDRIATTLLILGMYVKLLFVPHPLSWDYSYPQIPIVSFSDPMAIFSIAILLALGIYGIWGIKKKEPIAFAILFFFLSIAVVSNLFILIGATLGERFLFIPSIGFSMAIPIILLRLFKLKAEMLNPKQKTYTAVLGIVLLLFSIKTIDRNAEWFSNETLYISGAKASPNSARAVSAMGTAFRERGERMQDPNQRMVQFQQALQYYQRSVNLYPPYSQAWYNMGVTYNNMGQGEQAFAAFQETLKHDATNMNALNNIGVYYFQQQDLVRAEEYFRKAIAVNPNFGNPVGNLGVIAHNQGDYQKAMEYYEQSLRLDPYNQNIRGNLLKVYQALGLNDKINQLQRGR